MLSARRSENASINLKSENCAISMAALDLAGSSGLIDNADKLKRCCCEKPQSLGKFTMGLKNPQGPPKGLCPS